MLRVRLLAVALLGLVPLVSGCVGDEPTVALLVADGSDPATRAVDVEGFTDRVESWLYDDQEVTVDTLTSVLVAHGAVSLDDLCSGATEKRCARLGLR